MAKNEQLAWQQTLNQVGALRDALGVPVDTEIAEAVAVFTLLGFKTISSCGGHIQRTTGGPYVLFESPTAQTYAKQMRQINNTSDPTYEKLKQKARHHNTNEIARLLQCLESFYLVHTAPYRQQLIIQPLPPAMFNLRCIGVNVDETAGSSTKKKALAANQAEMHHFVEFLKQKFFA